MSSRSAAFGVLLSTVLAGASSAYAAPNCAGTVLNTNGSFEIPYKGTAVTWYAEPAANVPGWTTSSTAFELWANGFNGVPPYAGTQLNEINWNAADTLTTTAFTVQPRAELLVFWAHRGRVTNETANLQIRSASGTTLLNFGNFTSPTGSWTLRNTNVVMGTAATSVVLRLQAITTGGSGNLLDSVEACQTYLTIGKTLHNRIDVDGSGGDSAGDTLTYQYAISNPTGNARTISSPQIIDDRIGTVSAVTYRVSGDTIANNQLDPGETWIVRVPYSVTLANMNAGSVTNTAYVQGSTVANTLRSADATLTVSLTPAPQLTLEKTAWRGGIQITPSTPVNAGDVLEYRFQLTNVGNVTISGTSVTETAFNGTGTAPVPALQTGTTTLNPGQTALWTAGYTVTQSDIDLLQ